MLTQHQHTSSAVALALPSSTHSLHTCAHFGTPHYWKPTVSCAWAKWHIMRVLVSVISDFLHMRHSMFALTHDGMYRLRGINVQGSFWYAPMLSCACVGVWCQDHRVEGKWHGSKSSLAKSPDCAKSKKQDNHKEPRTLSSGCLTRTLSVKGPPITAAVAAAEGW